MKNYALLLVRIVNGKVSLKKEEGEIDNETFWRLFNLINKDVCCEYHLQHVIDVSMFSLRNIVMVTGMKTPEGFGGKTFRIEVQGRAQKISHYQV